MTEMPGNPYIKNAEYVDRDPQIRLVDAVLALTWEVRTQNLIACSQKVYIRDSPDQIRERLGEKGVGTPTPTTATVPLIPLLNDVLHDKLMRWETYTTSSRDTIAIDGLIDLPEISAAIIEALEEAGRL
jgi:hypothetical protein